ncbi:MAG: hypothetical protein IT495_00660 [Gammaproteobacteria bacterium]|nr:hypothetical protein [Gammaproteobacteria bacterium]
MNTCQRLLCAGGLALLASACAQRLEPAQVAQRFWNAVTAGDTGAAQLFVTADSRAMLRAGDGVLPIGDVQIGRTIIDGRTARVETTVTVLGDKPLAVPLNTRLREEDGRWKVDYDQTMAAIASSGELARALGRMRELNRQFSAELDKSMAELQRSLPAITRELERFKAQIQQQVPAIRQEIEDLARRLEDALKEARDPPAADPRPI